jgi:hypothetical protein
MNDSDVHTEAAGEGLNSNAKTDIFVLLMVETLCREFCQVWKKSLIAEEQAGHNA